MNDAEITLHQFFGWDEIRLTKEQSSTVEASKAYNEIRKTISAEANRVKSIVTKEWIIKELGNLLKQIPLADILLGAWNKSRQLSKYLDSTEYPPDEAIFVPLLEHTVTSTQRPYVEVLIGDRPIGKIQFEVSIELALEGVVLKIQGGKIKEIRSASGKGKGKIKIEGAEVLEKETESLAFPGVIDLGEGKTIEPVASKAELPSALP